MKKSIMFSQFIWTLLLLSFTAQSRDFIHVPSPDYPSITDAINAANDDAVIIVKPGTYRENLVIEGKSLSIVSSHGPMETILDGGGAGSVVYFNGAGDKRFSVEGFTIKNGTGRSQWPVNRGTSVKGKGKVKRNKPSVNPMTRRGEGGGLYCNLGHVFIRGNIVTGNKCWSSAGMYIASGAVVRENIISHNHALQKAGAIYFKNCDAKCFNNYFLSNLGGADGGGIYVWGKAGDVRIFDNLFFENWSQYGGAIIAHDTPIHIEDNVFFKNKGCRGGAVLCRLKGAEAMIRGNLMRGNWACFGGGICCLNGASPEIMDNVIYENTTLNPHCLGAPGQGSPVLDYSGGGIYCWPGCNPFITSNIINYNYSRKRGGGIGCIDASPRIQCNTIFANEAREEGGGINCLGSSAPRIANCIIWENKPDQILGGAEVAHCNVQGGWPGRGNLDQEPDFFNDEVFSRLILTESDVSAGTVQLTLTGASSAFGKFLVIGSLFHEPFFELPMSMLEKLPLGMEGDPSKGLPFPMSPDHMTYQPLGPSHLFWLVLDRMDAAGADLSIPCEPNLTGLGLSWLSFEMDSQEGERSRKRPLRMFLRF